MLETYPFFDVIILSFVMFKYGKISFFSDEYVRSNFKNQKIRHEFKVQRGKYSLYSINDESEQFKKDFPNSNTIGALLVKD